jgi:hypothetical protein
MTLGIYIPTFGRADKLQAVADNLKENTKSDYNLYWCVEEHDTESIDKALATGATIVINTRKPTYSDALQCIYEVTDEEIFLWGNDDFYFLPNWDEQPMEMMKDENIGVLGLHDGNPKTRYWSISLVRRKYITEQSGVVDMPNRVLYPYHHNFVDDELTATAIKRGVWSHCEAPCILHQHHSFKWLGDFPHDETYAKNDKHVAIDAETYNNRIHLWQ